MTDDNIKSLTVKRFDKITDPAAHDPSAALEAAMEWIKTAEEKPDHIIVIIGRGTKEGGSATRYFQAGNYAYHAQQGLCREGAHMIREAG